MKNVKPYYKRKLYKHKQGGAKYMLPGGRYGKSSVNPENSKQEILSRLFSALSQEKGFHSKRK